MPNSMIFNRRREIKAYTMTELLADEDEMAYINSAEEFPPDNRPHSRKSVLLDTGASCTVWPKAGYRAKPDPVPTLTAANGTRIKTYGKRTITIKFGDLTCTAAVTLADVRAPMLGWEPMVQCQGSGTGEDARRVLSEGRLEKSKGYHQEARPHRP